MINSRDSFSDYNPNSVNLYEVPYRVGEIVENKNDSNLLAMVSEIRITRNGMFFVLGFDRGTYDFTNVKVLSEEELINEWKKPDSERIIIWGKLENLNINLGLAEKMEIEYGKFEATGKGTISLVKRKK